MPNPNDHVPEIPPDIELQKVQPEPDVLAGRYVSRGDDELFVVGHGAIDDVLSLDPPRLLMRTPGGERFEVQFDDGDTHVVYDRDGDLHEVHAGWLVHHLRWLQETRRQVDEGAVAKWMHERSAQLAAGHLTHTTVPTPSTVSTLAGRLNVVDFSTVTVRRHDADVDDSQVGMFILIAHGFDYEGGSPKALWLQLRPIVDDQDPNHWLDPLPVSMPAPAGGWNSFADRFLGGQSNIDDPMPDDDDPLAPAYGLTPVQHEAGRVRATALQLISKLIERKALMLDSRGWTYVDGDGEIGKLNDSTEIVHLLNTLKLAEPLSDNAPMPEPEPDDGIEFTREAAITAIRIAQKVAAIQSYGSLPLTSEERDLLDEFRHGEPASPPAGWANTPGGTDKDREDARTAIGILRDLIELEAVVPHPMTGTWGGKDVEGASFELSDAKVGALLDDLHAGTAG